VPVLELEPHGAFLLIPSDDFRGLCDAVLAQGVNVDARPSPASPHASGAPRPGYVRVAPDILNTRSELAEAAARIARAFERV
jgi:hypothetical protein